MWVSSLRTANIERVAAQMRNNFHGVPMFSRPPKPESKPNGSFREVLVVLLALLGIAAYTKFGSFDRVYFHYYEYVWGGGVVAGV